MVAKPLCRIGVYESLCCKGVFCTRSVGVGRQAFPCIAIVIIVIINMTASLTLSTFQAHRFGDDGQVHA